MPVAISVKAANSTAHQIHALWEQVSRFEDQPSMRALAYPPHITLAVYDDLEHDRLRSALGTVFMGKPVLRVTFDRIRYFEGKPLVLWAAPSPHAILDQAHAMLHDLIDPALCRPHYRPGAWVPHCTLGTRVRESRRDDALEFVQRSIAPFDVLFDVADCVHFPPVAVIRECALAPPHSN